MPKRPRTAGPSAYRSAPTLPPSPHVPDANASIPALRMLIAAFRRALPLKRHIHFRNMYVTWYEELDSRMLLSLRRLCFPCPRNTRARCAHLWGTAPCPGAAAACTVQAAGPSAKAKHAEENAFSALNTPRTTSRPRTGNAPPRVGNPRRPSTRSPLLGSYASRALPAVCARAL